MISFSEAIKSRLAGAIAAARLARKFSYKGDTDIGTDAIGPKFLDYNAKTYSTLPNKAADIAMNHVYSPAEHGDESDDIKTLLRQNSAKRTKRIPLDKIHTAQGAVSKEVLINKLLGRHKEPEDPAIPSVYYHKKKDKYSLIDGNHRVAARKLRGFTHIRAAVINK